MLGKLLLALLLSAAAWGEIRPARPSTDAWQPGEVRLCSWNVHRFRGPNRQGAPDQQEQILQELRNRACDVVLLQQVPTAETQTVADRLGLRGYAYEMIPGQSLMMLLHPALLVVREDHVSFGERAAQFLDARTPQGETFHLWNCHLASGPREVHGEERLGQLAKLLEYLKPVALGGGDLNDEEIAEKLQEKGYQIQGDRLDWLTALGPGRLEGTVFKNLRDQNDSEVALSDHPLVVGTYRY